MQEDNKIAPAASSHTEIQIRPTSLSDSLRRIRTKELVNCNQFIDNKNTTAVLNNLILARDAGDHPQELSGSENGGHLDACNP
jgi:hypothetical protein